jgi:hypothetical protein
MAFYPVRDLRQLFLGELQEVRGGAVGFEGGVIFVLLVDEEPARFGLMAVDYVHGAARFFAGGFCQLGEDSGYVAFAPQFRHPRNSQDNHRTLRFKKLSAASSQWSVNSLKLRAEI